MRLVCPNCGAQYEVDDTAIPPAGREVQCSACDHIWFQPNPDIPPLPRAVEVGAWPPVPEDFARPQGPAEDPPPPSRALDENVLAVLREEAERESAARRAEAAAKAGLADVPAPPPPVPQSIEPAPAALKAKDLPDVEAINSTLRARSKSRQDPAQDMRSGFATGFVLVIVLAVLLTTLYIFAPRLAEMVPQLAEPMKAYVDLVDTIRRWIDATLVDLTDALRHLLGPNSAPGL